MNRFLPWRASLALSLIIHVVLGLFLFLYHPEEKEKGTPFVTSLVSPEELRELERGKPGGPVRRGPTAPAQPSRPSRTQRPSVPPSRSPSPRTGSGQTQTPVPSRGAEQQAAGENQAAPRRGEVGSGGQQGSPGTAPQGTPGPGDMKKTPPAPSMKEKLFDREVIQKFAKKEEPKKDNSITFDTDEFKYRTYMLRLREKIESIWQYPPDAVARGIQGDLRIRFTIRKDGMLGDIEIERTSGYRNLDEAALKALKDGQPYWPIPNEWGKDAIAITGHFIYSMYGAHIR